MSNFKFSVGPWNVYAGADSYGPATRNEIAFEEKIKRFAEIGFSAIQFHDDNQYRDIRKRGVQTKKRPNLQATNLKRHCCKIKSPNKNNSYGDPSL